MNVLEKILEEIEERIKIIKNIPVNEDDDFLDGEECYEDGRTQGRFEELLWCRDIICSHKDEMNNDGWIPVEERLPEEKINPITKDFYVYPVTFESGGVRDIRYYPFGMGHWWKATEIMDEYVKAWMPIPEPYRPKEKNNE